MKKARERLAFGEFLLDEERGVLLRAGQPVTITPRAHDTLRVFLANPGRLITKEELLDAVWPGLHVEENNLSQQVSALRKALGEGWIETVPRRGYRFVGEVRLTEASNAAAASAVPASHVSRQRWIAAAVVALIALAAVASFAFWHSRQLAPDPGHTASAPIASLAVLPFVPERAEPELGEVVGMGLAEAVIARLGAAGTVAVRPLAAVRELGGDMDPVAAAQRLQVDAVLQARFRWVGEQVRIAARLVDGRSGREVWSAPLVVNASQLSGLGDQLADAVSVRLQGGAARRAAVPEGGPSHVAPEAYTAYLRGRWHWGRRTLAELQVAEAEFRTALAREPRYAAAYAGLADALMTQSRHAEARTAAAHALALDDSLAEPYATLGFLSWFQDRDADAARSELGRAIELNPSYATAYQWLAFVEVTHARCATATAALARAHALDPLSLTIATDVAQVHVYCGEPAAAEREVRAALRLDPHFAQAYGVLGQVLTERGALAEAEEAFLEMQRLSGGGGGRTALFVLHARNGDRAAAEDDLAAIPPTNRSYYGIACGLAWLGRFREARAQLETAIAGRESDVMLLGVDPAAAALRTDPAAQAALRKLRLPLAAPTNREIADEAGRSAAATGQPGG